MKYKAYLFLILLIFSLTTRSQTIPLDRVYAWETFGLVDTTTLNFNIIDLNSQGIIGDGITANDSLFEVVLNSLSVEGNVLLFPAGTFYFQKVLICLVMLF